MEKIKGLNVKLGAMEDLNREDQLERAKLLSAAFVEVVTEAGTPLLVSEASSLVAKRMGMSVSQTSYGVSFARNTGALTLDENTFQLSLREMI